MVKAIKTVYEDEAKIRKAIGIKLLEYPEESFRSKSAIMSVCFKAPFDKEGTVANIVG